MERESKGFQPVFMPGDGRDLCIFIASPPETPCMERRLGVLNALIYNEAKNVTLLNHSVADIII